MSVADLFAVMMPPSDTNAIRHKPSPTQTPAAAITRYGLRMSQYEYSVNTRNLRDADAIRCINPATGASEKLLRGGLLGYALFNL